LEQDENVPRGFESSYQGFVWRELSIIRKLEREGNYYMAVQYSVSLLKYLQPEVRKKQETRGHKILEKVDEKVDNTYAVDLFTTQLVKNSVAAELGKKYLEEIITALSNQLGSRAYMEKKPRRTVHYGRFEE